MAFDPKRYEEIKAQSASAAPVGQAGGGFNPTTYEKIKAGMDFSRRAMMPSYEPAKSLPSTLATNFMRDVKDLASGTGILAGHTAMGGAELLMDALSPTKTVKRIRNLPGQVAEIASPEGRKLANEMIVQPTVQSMKKSFTDKHAFVEHPLNTAMDWGTALSLASGAVKTGLRAAGGAAAKAGAKGTATVIADILSTERAPLSVGPKISVPREFSESLIKKYAIQKPIDVLASRPGVREAVSAVPGVKALAPMELLTDEARMAKKVLSDTRAMKETFFITRNEKLADMRQRFSAMPENEREAFVAVVQGRALPRQMSKEFADTYKWYKAEVMDEQARMNLPEEVTKRAAYQPLIMAQGLLTRDDYALALKGDKAAQMKVAKVTDAAENARVRLQEQSLTSWLQTGKKGRPPEGIKTVASQIARDVAPDPIYFPAVFEKKIRLSDFLPNRMMQRFKPSFMRGRTGASGYITKEPEKALAVHQAQVEKWRFNESLIQDVTQKYAQPLKKSSDLKAGYTYWVPDGFFQFYRAAVPLQDAFLKGVSMGQDMDSAFMHAISEIMPSMIKDKNIIGVKRAQIYQIPRDVAMSLNEVMRPSAPFGAATDAVKLFHDTPIQAWKYAVLAMSPRWVVNNIAGNMFLTAMAGVEPGAFLKMADPELRKLIPKEVLAGGLRRTEGLAFDRVITQNSSLKEKALGLMTGDTPTEGILKDVQNVAKRPVRGIMKFADTVYTANTAVEDAFRGATYLDEAARRAKLKIAKDVNAGIFDTRKLLGKGEFSDANVKATIQKMSENKDFTDSIANHVDDVLNNYNKLSNFERQYVRRVVPFWSWWKFMHKTVVKMPFKHPLKTEIMSKLSAVGKDLNEREWRDHGLRPNEIPEWLKSSIPQKREGSSVPYLSTRGVNPLSTVGEAPGLSPLLNVLYERQTGRQAGTGLPFTSPQVTEKNGRYFISYDGGKTVESLKHPPAPPLATHLVRQIPQAQLAEALMYPYRLATGEPYMSGVPALNTHGQVTPMHAAYRIAQILGMPLGEANVRGLRKGKQAAREARPEIRKNMRRTTRVMERLKLGK